jgi:hypothetical protein
MDRADNLKSADRRGNKPRQPAASPLPERGTIMTSVEYKSVKIVEESTSEKEGDIGPSSGS